MRDSASLPANPRVNMHVPGMMILYVTDSPTVSGAEHVLLTYLERFPPEVRTHVFLRSSNHRLREELRRRRVAHTVSQSFSARTIRSTLRPDDLWQFAQSFRAIRRELVQLAATVGADVFHSISYPAALYTAFAARAARLPHIWHEHGVKQVHVFNRAIYRFVARSCDYVIGPSDAVTHALAVAGIKPPRLRTVYNGIDLRRFSNTPAGASRIRREFGLGEGDPAIGLVGQLLPHKGHVTLIHAAPGILRELPRSRFFIIGALENPPYEAELRQRIASASLGSAFTFTGWRSDVQDVIGAMDVSVVPTLTPEPAALSLMETMAVGRPVVASRSGGTPELVLDGETGLLFTPGHSDELAARVVELLKDRPKAERLGRAGRRRMEDRFTEERHLQEIAALYRQIVAERGRQAAPERGF